MTKGAERDEVITLLVVSLKEERLRQKLSLNEVATRSGLSHAMVGRVERRERMPTIDTLLRISEALKIDLSKFLSKALQTKKG